MENFWGVEVIPSQIAVCNLLEKEVLHLTQVALGGRNLSKEYERVYVYLHVKNKKVLIGTLISGRCDQIGLNLIFSKKFQISHSSKTTSLFFCGYYKNKPAKDLDSEMRKEEDEDDTDDDEEDEGSEESSSSDDKDEDEDDVDDEDVVTSKVSAGHIRPLPDWGTKAPRIDKKAKVATPEVDSDDDEEEDEDMEDVSGNDLEDEEDSDEDKEDEETPKVHAGEKRPLPDSDTKTPRTKKKAKVATPQCQKPGEGKKSVKFSTHYEGTKKGSRKGKETLGGSKQQPLASKKTPKSNGTPWPGKKARSVSKHAKGSSVQSPR